MKYTLLIIIAFVASAIATPAEDLALLLQKGLAEEEINRDPTAAIEQYGALLEEFDKSRQLAATALFRIAECSRKLGDEDAAAKNFQQLITLYPKQEKLVALSRQNLAALGIAPVLISSDGVEMSEEEAKAMIKYKEILRDRPDEIKNSKYLFEAIRANHVMATRFLLEQGSSPTAAHTISKNGTNSKNMFFIEWAVSNANLSIVKLLLSHGADVTPQSLATCVSYDYSSIEPVLLAAIKSKGEKFDYFPAFEKCIERNRKDTFNRLIANGADPKAFGAEGETLLLTAAKRGRSEFCERLIKTYEIPVKHRNKAGFSALDYAAYARSPETVKVLLSHGADPKALAASHLGKFAQRKQNVSVLMQLLNDGYERNHEAIVSIIDQLIAAGVDVNHQDSHGDTVLHYAVICSPYYRYKQPYQKAKQLLIADEEAAVVVALLNAGADKSLKSKSGKTPIQHARGAEFLQ